jgi:hypothetical protein
MRLCEKNKQKIYYATYVGKVPILDGSSNKTGSYTLSYSDPIELWINIAPANGILYGSMFGINANYSKVMVTETMDLSLASDSILWIDVAPTIAEDGSTTTKHDAMLGAPPAKSLNNVSYAVRYVSVS